jgi:hypothetical protein
MGGSPREDKDRDFKSRSASGSQHGLRKKRHRTKAAAHRRYRRAESAALAQSGSLADDGIADDVESRIATTRREQERRYGPPTLADHVTDRLVERFLDMVDTYSAGPYRPETQRARTEQALTEVTRQRPTGRPDTWLTRAALDLDALLPEPVFPGRDGRRRNTEHRRDWFTAFLTDRPEWKPYLHGLAGRSSGTGIVRRGCSAQGGLPVPRPLRGQWFGDLWGRQLEQQILQRIFGTSLQSHVIAAFQRFCPAAAVICAEYVVGVGVEQAYCVGASQLHQFLIGVPPREVSQSDGSLLNRLPEACHIKQRLNTSIVFGALAH